MLIIDPVKRPSFEDLIKDKFFNVCYINSIKLLEKKKINI